MRCSVKVSLLLRSMQARTDNVVINYVQWESEDDLRDMMESAGAKAHIAQVGTLAESVDPVVYRVVFVGSR